MARTTGDAIFSANFEPRKGEPLDARTAVEFKADLYLLATWDKGDGNAYINRKIPVVVWGDTEENNGVYRMAVSDDYTDVDNWKRVGDLSLLDSLTAGFDKLDKATISFTDLTRTLQISPIGTEFTFYQAGKKYSLATDSIVIPDVEGMYAVYYNNGVLFSVLNPTDSQVSSLIRNNPTVAYVYWNATDKKHEYLGYEMHEVGMSPDTRNYAHFAFGARYLGGMLPTDVVVGASGNLDTSAQFGITNGAIADENIYLATAAVLSTVGLPIFYLAGPEATPYLRGATNPGFSVLTAGTGRIAFNTLVGGVWVIQEVINKDYVFCHVIAINENNGGRRIVAFTGQQQYLTVALAVAGVKNEIKELKTSGVLPQERVEIASFLFQTDSGYGNAVQARLVAIDANNDWVDWTGGALSSPGSSTPQTTFSDADFTLFNDADISKVLLANLANLTPGATRVVEAADKSGRMVLDKVVNVELTPSADGVDAIRITKADGTTKSVTVDTLLNLLTSNNDLIMQHPLDPHPYMKFIRGVIKSITDGLANPDSGFTDGTLINFISTLNQFAQVNIRNLSDGPAASTDMTQTANDGTNDDHYNNQGINSSEFQYDPLAPLGTGPRTAYYLSTEEMHFYNTVLKPLLFGTNGTLRLRIDENGALIYGGAWLSDPADMGSTPGALVTKQYADSLMLAQTQTVIASGASTVVNLSLGRFIRFDISGASSPHSISFINQLPGIEYYLFVIQEAVPIDMEFPLGTMQAGGGGNTVPGLAWTHQMVAVLYSGTQYLISTQRYF